MNLFKFFRRFAARADDGPVVSPYRAGLDLRTEGQKRDDWCLWEAETRQTTFERTDMAFDYLAGRCGWDDLLLFCGGLVETISALSAANQRLELVRRTDDILRRAFPGDDAMTEAEMDTYMRRIMPPDVGAA